MIHLEIIIATSFVLFLLSSLVSGINEMWALLLNKRGRELRRALQLAFPELSDELMRRFYSHPLILPLKEKPKGDSIRGGFLKIINLFRTDKFQHDFLPSYIDSDLFSKALADILVLGKEFTVSTNHTDDWERNLFTNIAFLDHTNFELFSELYPDDGLYDEEAKNYRERLMNKSGDEFQKEKLQILDDLRRSMKSNLLMHKDQQETCLLDNYLLHSATEAPSTSDFLARNSVDLKTWLENSSQWFDGYMHRVSGWYKKRSHTNIFWWSLILVVFFNINLFEFISELYKNQALRDFWVENAVSAQEAKEVETKIQESVNTLGSILSFQVPKADTLLKNLPGWLATVFAISLGAPFWFDLLGKAVNLRAAGKEKTTES